MASVALIIIFITAMAIKHLFFWHPMDVSHLYADGPLKMGHRGSPMAAPENTLPSYRQAVKAGLKSIEMDVIATKDGYLVYSHNHDLERETDGFGYIHKMTLDELRSIDAGIKFPQFSPSKIPLLEEAVEADGAAEVSAALNAKDQDKAQAAMAKIVKSCDACHDDFR